MALFAIKIIPLHQIYNEIICRDISMKMCLGKSSSEWLPNFNPPKVEYIST